MIVYIITKLELGGAQKVCITLARQVSKTFQTALVSGPRGTLVATTNDLPSRYLIQTLEREVGLKSILSDIRAFFHITRLLRKLKKEHPTIIVHTHSTKAGILGRWAAFFAGIKIRVHTIHGYAFHNHQSRLRWLLCYLPELITSFITTRFICVSGTDMATGQRLFYLFKNKTSLIRAAVDDHFFTAQKDTRQYTHSSPFIIGSIACFKPQKNIIDLLKAFQHTHQTLIKEGLPAPQLQIIGDGEQRAMLTTWVAEHQLSQAVIFLGWQNNVLPFLANWDVFALTSLWEGLPCSVIEARLLKLPVITYNSGGIAEVIYSGKNGYIVPPGDWLTLANHLIGLARQPSLQHALGLYADDLIDFDNNTMVKEHTTLYKNLLDIKNG